MTTLATQDCQLEKKAIDVIPANIRGYFQQRACSRAHQLLLEVLRLEEQVNSQFSKRLLAKRIEKKPEQITRWLSYPSNLTLDTLSELLLGMGRELILEAKIISTRKVENIENINLLIINIPINLVKTSKCSIKDERKISFDSSRFSSNSLTYRSSSHA